MALKISAVSLATFNETLSRYAAAVPDKLRNLDEERYNTIPTAIANSNHDDSNVYLSKPQVETLVEWKLNHGTFRPKLLQLVQSNPKDVIEGTTKEACLTLESGRGPLPALKKLVELKGIGPATASLLLSVFDPATTPFFSDELFRWAMWDEPGGGGWKRSIRYNVKEYEQLVGKVGELVKKLGVRAIDVEKVAWVLGKEGVDISKGMEGEEEPAGKLEEKAGDDEEVKAKKPTMPKKGTKRKIDDEKAHNEGTRRSSRKKT